MFDRFRLNGIGRLKGATTKRERKRVGWVYLFLLFVFQLSNGWTKPRNKYVTWVWLGGLLSSLPESSTCCARRAALASCRMWAIRSSVTALSSVLVGTDEPVSLPTRKKTKTHMNVSFDNCVLSHSVRVRLSAIVEVREGRRKNHSSARCGVNESLINELTVWSATEK